MVKLGRDGTITESLRIPVRGEYDVAVAGGGLAGTMAALAAARGGTASVTLAEQNTFLGGGILAASGVWDDCPDDFGQDTPVGELLTRLVARGGSPGVYGGRTHGDREWLPQTLLEMVRESGIQLYLQSAATGLIQKDGAAVGMTVAGKYGTEALLAGEVIDATGNGILALQAGVAPKTRRPARARAAVGLGGVDLERALAGAGAGGRLREVYREGAGAEGRILRLCFDAPFVGADILPQICLISNLPGRATQLSGVRAPREADGARARAAACIRLSAASTRLAALLKERAPGFEDAFLDWTTSVPEFDFGSRFAGEQRIPGFTISGRAVLEDGRGVLRSGWRAGRQAVAHERCL
jgi:hypothetical protein